MWWEGFTWGWVLGALCGLLTAYGPLARRLRTLSRQNEALRLRLWQIETDAGCLWKELGVKVHGD